MPVKTIFFDRDGVLVIPKVENNKHYAPRSYSEFSIYPNAKAVIGKIKKLGYLCIIITNQPDIAKGLISQKDINKMNNELKTKLKIDDIFICPHIDKNNCDCRKPKPGMIIDSAKKWNIDLSKSFLIGDLWRDIEAGKSAGLKTILLKRSYNGDCQPDFVIDELPQVIDIISKTTTIE